ncbi:MAG: hypothetical protein Q8P29_02315 [Candidatus Levybacteria bacterium]|nr:hypothetical protein [Candidatus Levybacteria bacterium]
MTSQESQPKTRGLNGGRKTNLPDIDNFFRKRETGLKYKVISNLTGIPISTLEGYKRDFTRDADGNIVRKIKKQF